jgi:hypothetical protein
MTIREIESEWRETGIYCPFCEPDDAGPWMTYTDGVKRPQCCNPDCLETLPDEYIWEWLITLPEYHDVLLDTWHKKAGAT